MTKAELHRLVDELPDESLDRAAIFLKHVTLWQPDPDQAWFWTPEWLQCEIEAEAQLAAGQGTLYRSDEEFLAHLDRIPPTRG
ncbi:MAG: hypothetical protein ACR2PL_23165 [Dehalococcoidia bacterium]